MDNIPSNLVDNKVSDSIIIIIIEGENSIEWLILQQI